MMSSPFHLASYVDRSLQLCTFIKSETSVVIVIFLRNDSCFFIKKIEILLQAAGSSEWRIFAGLAVLQENIECNVIRAFFQGVSLKYRASKE